MIKTLCEQVILSGIAIFSQRIYDKYKYKNPYIKDINELITFKMNFQDGIDELRARCKYLISDVITDLSCNYPFKYPINILQLGSFNGYRRSALNLRFDI